MDVFHIHMDMTYITPGVSCIRAHIQKLLLTRPAWFALRMIGEASFLLSVVPERPFCRCLLMALFCSLARLEQAVWKVVEEDFESCADRVEEFLARLVLPSEEAVASPTALRA